jgi:heme/copper-type cytochrome/quinol oxidase subunit 4
LYTTVNITNSSLIEEKSKVETKNYGKIAGVGLGVFLTIMAMILGVILCIIGTATPAFFVFLLIGILIPLITFLIVAFAPLNKDQEEKADTRTDDFFAARVIFLLVITIFALLAIVKLFEYYVGINLKAKGVNSNTSAISSADLIAPDANGQNNPANPLNPLNPLAGNQNMNPLIDGNNPLAGNNPLNRNNPLVNQANPLAAGNERNNGNPLLGDARDNRPFNPLLGAGPAEHPLAPLK